MADDYRQRCADAAMNAWSMHAVVCDHSQTIPIGNLVDAVLAVRDDELAQFRDIHTAMNDLNDRTRSVEAASVIVSKRVAEAEAEVARLRAGEADELPPPGTNYTPAQWIRRWNQATPEERLDWAKRVLDNAAAAERCFIAAHDGMQAELDTALAVLTRIHAHPETREQLRKLSIDPEVEAYVSVRRADLDLVMNHAGDPAAVADYPAAAQRIHDALEGGQRG